MLGATLTTILFSLSVILANRSIRAFGSDRANLGRLFVAVLALGTYAHIWGGGLGGAGRFWFFMSGVIAMGLGDIALFGALPRIGSRLSLLMTQCLSAPIAALTEWLWLDTRLTISQLLASATILIGVVLALAPAKAETTTARLTFLGLACGFLSAAGQGLGAVLSRKANAVAHLAGEHPDGITAAYQRIVCGFGVALVWIIAIQLLRAHRHRTAATTPATPTDAPSDTTPARRPRDYSWVILNALAGPILGVSCFQWALSTTPSGIVLPIMACSPLVVIPFSYWLEGERPSARSLLGGAVAVAGAVALSMAH